MTQEHSRFELDESLWFTRSKLYTTYSRLSYGSRSLFGIGYTPQQQMLEALGLGTKTAGLADIGRRTGAELFGQLGQTGLETLMQGAELAQGLEASKRQSLTEALLGREPTLQEQLMAN